MTEPTPSVQADTDERRAIVWSHGRFELQRLGAMLAPVEFREPGHAPFAPMQVAPWADEPASAALPGLLRRLRGDWPCLPFGRTDRPEGLPAGWTAREPDDGFGHGYGAHHDWRWLEAGDPNELALEIDYPATHPVRRLVRRVRALPGAHALECLLEVEVRRPCRLPLAMHPTLRLDLGRVELALAHRGPCVSYPVPAEAGVSRLVPDRAFAQLAEAPLEGGGALDLTRFPLPFDSEELLQVTQVDGPVELRYPDAGWALQLAWDAAALPDLMLWVSHRGRQYAPWNGRHLALGVEPLNGVFDLGRVTGPPPGHPLAARGGIAFEPGRTWTLRTSFRAGPLRE